MAEDPEYESIFPRIYSLFPSLPSNVEHIWDPERISSWEEDDRKLWNTTLQRIQRLPTKEGEIEERIMTLIKEIGMCNPCLCSPQGDYLESVHLD